MMHNKIILSYLIRDVSEEQVAQRLQAHHKEVLSRHLNKHAEKYAKKHATKHHKKKSSSLLSDLQRLIREFSQMLSTQKKTGSKYF